MKTRLLALCFSLFLTTQGPRSALTAPQTAPSERSARVIRSAGAIRPPFRGRWSVTLPEQIDSMVVRGRTTAYGTFNTYGALDSGTGKQLWKRTFADPGFGTGLAESGGRLYVCIGQRELVCCDLRTGAVHWRIPKRGFATPPVIHGGLLLVELQPGELTGLDLRTRRSRWKRRIFPKSVPASVVSEGMGLTTQPIVQDGHLIVSTFAEELLSLNARTGNIRWRTSLPARDGAWTNGLAADRTQVYVSGNAGDLRAFDLRTGSRRWHVTLPERICGAGIRTADLFLVTATDGRLHALAASNGRERWAATLSRGRSPVMTPPTLSVESIIAGTGTTLFALAPSGAQRWKWDIEEELWESPLIAAPGALLAAGSHSIHRVEMGSPPALPASPDARRRLVLDLLRRLDRLSPRERRILIRLDREAAPALLGLLKEKLVPHLISTAVHQEPPRNSRTRSSQQILDVIRLLASVMQPEITPEVISLLRQCERVGTVNWVVAPLFRLLMGEASFSVPALPGRADSELVLPLALAELRKPDPGAGTLPALDFVSRSHQQGAVEFLIEALRDHAATADRRSTAFVNLARTGGARGLAAVLAARAEPYPLPGLSDRLRLDPGAGAPNSARMKQNRFGFSLWESRVDGQGREWGLFSGPALGTEKDLYLTYRENGEWASPSLLEQQRAPGETPPWPRGAETNAQLRADADGDGWTDLMERRLGTNPQRRDTDGDGIADGEDANPLAKPRPLTEAEQVLAAAFEGRFRFTDDKIRPCLVQLPPGVAPLELTGWGWLTFASPHTSHPLYRYLGQGAVAGVSFTLPETDFSGAAVHGRGPKSGRVILWSPDRTQAKVQISTYYGPLNATGYDIRLRKFGDQWVVVEAKMTWIS